MHRRQRSAAAAPLQGTSRRGRACWEVEIFCVAIVTCKKSLATLSFLVAWVLHRCGEAHDWQLQWIWRSLARSDAAHVHTRARTQLCESHATSHTYWDTNILHQHSTAQHSTAQHSTAQHSTAQHSTAQHSTAQHSTAQHSTAHSLRITKLNTHRMREKVPNTWPSTVMGNPVPLDRFVQRMSTMYARCLKQSAAAASASACRSFFFAFFGSMACVTGTEKGRVKRGRYGGHAERSRKRGIKGRERKSRTRRRRNGE